MDSSPFPTGAVRPMAFQVDLLSHPEEEADLQAEAGHRSHRAGADHPGEEEEEAAPGEAGAQVSVFRSVPVRMVSHPQLRPRQVAEAAAAAASEAALEAVLEAAEDRPEEAELRPRPQ